MLVGGSELQKSLVIITIADSWDISTLCRYISSSSASSSISIFDRNENDNNDDELTHSPIVSTHFNLPHANYCHAVSINNVRRGLVGGRGVVVVAYAYKLPLCYFWLQLVILWNGTQQETGEQSTAKKGWPKL